MEATWKGSLPPELPGRWCLSWSLGLFIRTVLLSRGLRGVRLEEGGWVGQGGGGIVDARFFIF